MRRFSFVFRRACNHGSVCDWSAFGSLLGHREALAVRLAALEREGKEKESEWRNERLQAQSAQDAISEQAQSLREQLMVSREETAKVGS